MVQLETGKLPHETLPVSLFDCHLKKNEVSYNLGCGKHQFYLTPENSQVYNLRAN